MIHRPARIASVGLLCVTLFAACGDDDEDSSDATTEEVDATESDEGETDETEAAEPEETEPIDVSDGGCQVGVTGEVETSWTSPEDAGSVLYGPWLSDVEATVLDMNFDATDFLMNCTTEERGVSFTGNGEFEIPMEPATYTISATQGALGGGASEIGAIINLGPDLLYGMAADGNLTIARASTTTASPARSSSPSRSCSPRPSRPSPPPP